MISANDYFSHDNASEFGNENSVDTKVDHEQTKWHCLNMSPPVNEARSDHCVNNMEDSRHEAYRFATYMTYRYLQYYLGNMWQSFMATNPQIFDISTEDYSEKNAVDDKITTDDRVFSNPDINLGFQVKLENGNVSPKRETGLKLVKQLKSDPNLGRITKFGHGIKPRYSGSTKLRHHDFDVTPEAKEDISKIENVIGPYECKLCLVLFDNAFHLAKHKCPNLDDTCYTCDLCHKKFNCLANLASHQRWHSNFDRLGGTFDHRDCLTGENSSIPSNEGTSFIPKRELSEGGEKVGNPHKKLKKWHTEENSFDINCITQARRFQSLDLHLTHGLSSPYNCSEGRHDLYETDTEVLGQASEVGHLDSRHPQSSDIDRGEHGLENDRQVGDAADVAVKFASQNIDSKAESDVVSTLLELYDRLN